MITIQSHPSFKQPIDIDVNLWRYMAFEKFEWLIREKRLYMSSPSQLGDFKEGTMTQGEHQHWKDLINANHNDNSKRPINRIFSG